MRRSPLLLLAAPLLALLLAASAAASLPTFHPEVSYSSAHVTLVDSLEAFDPDSVMLESTALAVPAACPPQARLYVDLCERLVDTVSIEGALRPRLGAGEEICHIARFALDDVRSCAKVHDHVAEVGQRWDLEAHRRGKSPFLFCVEVLAEPVNSRALLSPRTERKCKGTQTPEDVAADMEPAAPEGYTGNILEDPFNTDVMYINNCRCECKGRNPDAGCCSCGKGAAAPAAAAAAPAVAAPIAAPAAAKPASLISVRAKINALKKKVVAESEAEQDAAGDMAHVQVDASVTQLPTAVPRPQTPLAPLVPPSSKACVKGEFLYQFPYTTYLPTKDEVHLVADFELQRLRVYEGEKVLKEYEMSSSELGIGSAVGSLKSPSGHFRISQKIGAGAAIGADFENLHPNGRSSGPTDKSAVQTRVLVLDGVDQANKNTRSRLIYIHGTNKAATIGRPASQGSFRLLNPDVIDLFGRVKEGTRFFAVPRCAWPKESASVLAARAVPAAAAAPAAAAPAAAAAAAPAAAAPASSPDNLPTLRATPAAALKPAATKRK